MDFKQTKEEADKAILDIYKEYLDNGYQIDLEKSSETALRFTKLINVDADNLKAKFSRVQVAQNPTFTEKNFYEEKKYACKHPITPYLISTATVIEPIDMTNIFNLSEIEIALIEERAGMQLTIPNYEKSGIQTSIPNYERGE